METAPRSWRSLTLSGCRLPVFAAAGASLRGHDVKRENNKKSSDVSALFSSVCFITVFFFGCKESRKPVWPVVRVFRWVALRKRNQRCQCASFISFYLRDAHLNRRSGRRVSRPGQQKQKQQGTEPEDDVWRVFFYSNLWGAVSLFKRCLFYFVSCWVYCGKSCSSPVSVTPFYGVFYLSACCARPEVKRFFEFSSVCDRVKSQSQWFS